ncbi:MAG: ABC transporter permease, partial [Haliea sp.]|nr:ABC transporter permease [Haliea sp.]
MTATTITDATLAEQGTSLWQDAWRRLRKNRLALF